MIEDDTGFRINKKYIIILALILAISYIIINKIDIVKVIKEFTNLKTQSNSQKEYSNNKTILLEEEESKGFEDEPFIEESNTSIMEPLDKPVDLIIIKNEEIQLSNSVRCTDMDIGKYELSSECERKINEYIDRYKNARYFKVIGIVDTTDFKLYKKLQANSFIYENLKTNQNEINRLRKLSEAGLAKFRTIEASWVIKLRTNKLIPTYNLNYHITSTKGERGVIIRAQN